MDDFDGNVGVGLDSPLAKLHVAGTFRVDTSGTVLYPTGPGAGLGTDPALYVTGARVGINTMDPEAALDVVGSVRFSSYAGYGTRNLGVDSIGNIVLMSTGSSSSSLWSNGSAGVIYYNG